MSVGVVSQSTLTIRLLDLFLRGTALDAQYLVIVFSFAELFESLGFLDGGLVLGGSV